MAIYDPRQSKSSLGLPSVPHPRTASSGTLQAAREVAPPTASVPEQFPMREQTRNDAVFSGSVSRELGLDTLGAGPRARSRRVTREVLG